MLPGFPSVIQSSYNVLCQIRDGILKIAPAQKVSQHNGTFSGTATDTYGQDITLPFPASTLDVILFDNGAIIKRSPEVTGQYDDPFELIAPGHYSFKVNTQQVNIKNAVPGSNARYSFIAFD